jgi:hypothetical protein
LNHKKRRIKEIFTSKNDCKSTVLMHKLNRKMKKRELEMKSRKLTQQKILVEKKEIDFLCFS